MDGWLRRFDHAVFCSIEQFCHWFQRLTGLTNFWWARLTCFLITGIAVTGWHAVKASREPFSFVVISYSVVTLTLSAVEFLVSCLLEEYYADGTTVAHSATLEAREATGKRVESLVLSVGLLLFSMLFGNIPGLGSVSSLKWVGRMLFPLYALLTFFAVIPLPPGKSKIRKLWEAFITPPPQLVPIPVSVPKRR